MVEKWLPSQDQNRGLESSDYVPLGQKCKVILSNAIIGKPTVLWLILKENKVLKLQRQVGPHTNINKIILLLHAFMT